MKWFISLLVMALVALIPGVATPYTLKQRSIRAADGSMLFACVTQPFEGTIAFVPSEHFNSGTAAIVIPVSNYAAFQRRRYPAPWYAAAIFDIGSGNLQTPAARQFDRETGKVPTVMFQAEGNAYGNYDRPYLPLDGPTLDSARDQIDAAIANCRLR